MIAISHQNYDSLTRLHSLGLTVGPLLVSVRAAVQAERTLSLNHPGLYRNVVPWGEAQRALREEMIHQGWRPFEAKGLPYTINTDETIGLFTTKGNVSTGRPDETPTTLHRKGLMTQGAVEENELQLILFPREPFRVSRSKFAHPWTTWILLYYVDTSHREVRCELSLPDHFDESSRSIDGWAERIILPSMHLDSLNIIDGNEIAPRITSESTGPEIEIDISRRQ